MSGHVLLIALQLFTLPVARGLPPAGAVAADGSHPGGRTDRAGPGGASGAAVPPDRSPMRNCTTVRCSSVHSALFSL